MRKLSNVGAMTRVIPTVTHSHLCRPTEGTRILSLRFNFSNRPDENILAAQSELLR